MKGKLDKETLKNLKEETRSLVHRLKDEKGMTSQKIADDLNKEIAGTFVKKKSKDAIDKWYQGGSAPDNNEVIIIVEKLKKILGIPAHLTSEKDNNYGPPPKSLLVWIPFDLKLPVADYNGINQPLSVIQMAKKKGIVAFRNSSKYDGDGEIYIDHIGMATGIEPGTKITIKRIDKKDWKMDRFYLIIDASGQVSVWELLPGDGKKTVKYISTSAPEGPYMELPLERIDAMFSIVDGNCIPRPKRNSLITSTSLQ